MGKSCTRPTRNSLQYRQTLQMSEEDAQFIEHVYELADEEEQPDYTD